MSRRKTTENFVSEVRKIHGDKYDYSKVNYINNKTDVCIICHEKDENGVEHGEFWQNPQVHIKGFGCSKCSGKHNYTNSEFIEKANIVHGGRYTYTKTMYKSAYRKVVITCPIHGDFIATPNDHLNNKSGCPLCAKELIINKKSSNTNEFIEKSIKVHGNKYDYSKVNYINAHAKVCIICQKHGEFYQTPNDHLNGKGCAYCNRSKLEEDVKLLLEENNIAYNEQKTFKWLGLQRLDFYLPKYNVAIECQGRQHFEGVNFGSNVLTSEQCLKECQERDLKKNKLCCENNVKLLYFSNLGIDYPYEVIENKDLLIRKIYESSS